ncbi:hypothetical protein ACF06N_26205 [Streptomyces albidoflavus]
MNVCARCDKPIRPDEDYDRLAPDSMSGARPDVFRHLNCPGRPRLNRAWAGRRE